MTRAVGPTDRRGQKPRPPLGIPKSSETFNFSPLHTKSMANVTAMNNRGFFSPKLGNLHLLADVAAIDGRAPSSLPPSPSVFLLRMRRMDAEEKSRCVGRGVKEEGPKWIRREM